MATPVKTITANGDTDIKYAGGSGTIAIQAANFHSASITFKVSFDDGTTFHTATTQTFNSISAVTANAYLSISEQTGPCTIRLVTASISGGTPAITVCIV
jgi:hypothetical protein